MGNEPKICGVLPDPALPDSGLRFIDLGRMAYAPALAMQRQVHAEVLAGQTPTVLFVEHDPVITISRRKGAGAHLLASRDQLASLGIAIEETDRGGDITYHGPGQIVAYPIIRLNDLGLNIGRYMRLLEQVIIDAIAPFGVTGHRDGCATGVWVDMNPMKVRSAKDEVQSEYAPHIACASALLPQDAPPIAKLAALGVRVSRNVTLHGLALNVTTNLAHFNTIVPCGLLGRSVTSLEQLLGDRTPAMEEVKAEMTRALRRYLQNHVEQNDGEKREEAPTRPFNPLPS